MAAKYRAYRDHGIKKNYDYIIDHLVILGNHHDAWTFGAVDPNSGTAVLIELARVA